MLCKDSIGRFCGNLKVFHLFERLCSPSNMPPSVMRHFDETLSMTTKHYNILLGDHRIGTTELEKADAPMGVVFGKVMFDKIVSDYDFFINYCINNDIKIIADYPADCFIATADIPNLKVIDPSGIEIKGQGANIEGMDSDIFEVTIFGVPYPFFENEFPHHVSAYNDQFKER